MSRTQRLTFLAIAAVIAVVAVVVLTSGGSDGPDTASAPTTPTATPSATREPQEASPAETPTATPRPRPRIPTLKAGSVRELEAKQGDTVRFRVTSSGPEEVHVHGYDLMKDVAPGEPATFAFKADITGIFEIELEQSGTQLASLKVEP